MKKSVGLPLLLLYCLLLSGCSTTGDYGETETILSEREQKSLLAKARPPQQYGFEIFRVSDGIGTRGDARLHPNHLAQVKCSKGSIPVIEVRGKSRRNSMNVLLDTSSPGSWLELGTAQDFGVHFLGMDGEAIPYRGGYNLGGANAYAGVITQLRIDQLFMENIPFYTRMAINSLGPLDRGVEVPPVHAVFGYDNLKNFEYIQFDFDAGVIRFSSTIPYVPHEDLVMARARIKRVPNYGLAVDGAIFGEPTPIIIDLAGDYHFARGDKKVSVTKQVSIDDIVWRKVPTMLLPVNSSPPRAGRKLFEGYIITVASREGIVYFERVPE
jgi:hypothetical protein